MGLSCSLTWGLARPIPLLLGFSTTAPQTRYRHLYGFEPVCGQTFSAEAFASWLARLVGKVQGHRFLTCCLVLALLVLLCCNVLDWTNISLSLMLFAVKRLAYLPFAQRRTASATRSLACRRASGHLGRSSCARRRLSYRTSHE